jgi:hypothetical protein
VFISHIFNVVQRIEDPEYIQTVLNCLLGEIVDSVIAARYLDLGSSDGTPHSRVAGVADTVGAADQRLEWNVGHKFPQSTLDKHRIKEGSK